MASVAERDAVLLSKTHPERASLRHHA
jgi:hypothetical protein